MKQIFILISVLLLTFQITSVYGQEEYKEPETTMRENRDGVIKDNEYRVISLDGSLTRRPCPYTCEMRGIPRQHCREFKSGDGTECYVKDTRYPDSDVLG